MVIIMVIAMLSYCSVDLLSYRPTVMLSYCPVQSYCPSVDVMPCFPTVLSGGVMLSCCPSVPVLSYCPAVMFLCCHVVLLSCCNIPAVMLGVVLVAGKYITINSYLMCQVFISIY